LDRRNFINLAAAGVVAAIGPRAATAAGRFKAIAFDGFVIFDSRATASLAEELFPGRVGVVPDRIRSSTIELATFVKGA